MEYTNHIMKAADASELQAAIEGGELVSPYVALNQDTGEIFYDNFVPDEPEVQTMGVWGDDGEGNYTFQITETDTTYWETEVKIGELLGVYSDGNYGNLDVMLNYNQDSYTWHMVFYTEEASNTPESDFEEGLTYTWESGAMTDPDDYYAVITVDWDGTSTFTFYTLSSEAPISISTYDPEYPAGE